MSGYLILAILALAFLVVFQIAKASEYVAVLKGEEKTFRQNNRINAFLFIAFLVLGLAGAWWCNELFYDKTLVRSACSFRPWREDRLHALDYDYHYRCRIPADTGIIVLVCL